VARVQDAETTGRGGAYHGSDGGTVFGTTPPLSVTPIDSNYFGVNRAGSGGAADEPFCMSVTPPSLPPSPDGPPGEPGVSILE
jgi:hypothetical protein